MKKTKDSKNIKIDYVNLTIDFLNANIINYCFHQNNELIFYYHYENANVKLYLTFNLNGILYDITLTKTGFKIAFDNGRLMTKFLHENIKIFNDLKPFIKFATFDFN